MKSIYRIAIILLATNLLTLPVYAFCILGFGTSCKIQDITNTATNKLQVGDVTSNTQTTIGDTTNTTTIGETTQTVNADIIKSFIGSSDANSLFLPLTSASTKQLDFQKETISDLKVFVKEIIAETAKREQERTERSEAFIREIIKQVTTSPPTIPIVSGSSSFPIILPTNSQTTPIYINEISPQLSNTLNNLNTTLQNMALFPANNTNSSSTTSSIPQTAHGFVVGDLVYLSGTNTYAKADSDASTTYNSVGVVTTVTDANNFTITTEGAATITGATYTPGSQYFVGPTAGVPTTTKPSANAKAVFIARSATEIYVQQYEAGATAQSLSYMHINNSNVAGLGTLANGVVTYIGLAQVDTNNALAPTSGIYTAPTSGRYYVTGVLSAQNQSATSDDTMFIEIRVSGTVVYTQVVNPSAYTENGEEAQIYIDGIVTVTAGQTISIALSGIDDVMNVVSKSFTVSQLPTAIVPVVDSAAEYGEVVASGSVTPTTAQTSSSNAATFMTFTLPSAGVWEVITTIASISDAAGGTQTGIIGGLFNSSNTLIPNSEIRSSFFSNNFTAPLRPRSTGTGIKTITTTGAETFTVRVWNHTGTGTGSAESDNQGRSVVSFKKIAGQLASTGSTVDYVNVVHAAASNFTIGNPVIFDTIASGNIPYNTTTGVFTLTANKVYKLSANIYTTTNGNVQWQTLAGTPLNTSQGRTTGSTSASNATYDVIYAPTVNTDVRLMSVSSGSITTDNNSRVSAVITQINTTNTIGGNTNVTDQSSSGYFDIGNMRVQWGTYTQGSGQTAVTLPVPFANTNYVVTGNNQSGGSNTTTHGTAFSSKTTTGFNAITNSTNLSTFATSASATIGWVAIGQKP